MKSNVGDYLKPFITEIPADLTSKEAKNFKKSIHRFPDECVYIYSFKEGRVLYADGWEEVVGYKNEAITFGTIVSLAAPEFSEFVSELKDKAMIYIHTKSKELEKFGYSVEMKLVHKNGNKLPALIKVAVYESEKGKVVSIIGRFQVIPSLRFSKMIQYSVFGPDKDEIETELNKMFRYKYVISNKEREALLLVAKGYSFKEVAAFLHVSASAIEKRILPMYKRFNVRSLSHLISFAYDNLILY